MLDPLVGAIAIGFIGAILAGPALAYGLNSVPVRWRKSAEWVLVIGAAAVAFLTSFLPVGFVYVLAALPGVVAYLAFRTLAAAALVSLAPLYFVFADLTRGRPSHAPYIGLDAAFPLEPAWVFVYGSLYVFMVPLPVLVVRQRELLHRAMQAYLAVMLASYVGFLVYPTIAPRPDAVDGAGFAAWSLRVVYDIDPPHGCFPSLHVAYSFVAALTCSRVNRAVGAAALSWATLIGLSTLYTKQHYVVDVIAGALAALAAHALFLSRYRREQVPRRDRERAPRRALAAIGLYALVVAGFWVGYLSD